MYKYVLAVLTLLVLATPVYADNYEINGSVVYINDSNVLLEAFPHTIIDSGYVTFNLTTKWYDGDIDAIWGFNSMGAMPKTGELLKPHNVTAQKSYTCDAPYWYNYTTTPIKHFYCWQDVYEDETNETIKSIIIFDHEFESANLTINTAYWSETHVEDYVDIYNNLNKVSFDYGGMDTWYYTKNVSVVSGNEYSVRAWIDVPFNSGYNKYWFCVKPTSMTIQQANNTGYLYCLDPFWNSSWDYRKEIQIDGVGLNIIDNYQIFLNRTYDSGMNDTFKDLRYTWLNGTTEQEISYWVEKNISGEYAEVWVKIPEISNTTNTTIFEYYGNNDVETTSNGTATFLEFDEFVDLSQWTVSLGTPTISTTVYNSGTSSAYLDSNDQMWRYTNENYTRDVTYYIDGRYTVATANKKGYLSVFYEYGTGGQMLTVFEGDTYDTYYDAGYQQIYDTSINTWYRLKTHILISSQVEARSAEFFVDGTSRLNATGFQVEPFDEVGKIYIYDNAVDQNPFYIDRLLMTEYSEVEPTYSVGDKETNDIAPTVTIYSPTNTTYDTTSIDLNWSANETLLDAWYSLNGGSNVSLMELGDDSAIASGLGDVGYFSAPTVFEKDSTWYLIAGEEDGVFNGYNWTGSIWQADTAIASGLGDVGQFSAPTVFQKDSIWYLIAGEEDGVFNGYNWTGSAWQSDSAIASGLGYVGYLSTPIVFYKDGTWYLVSGENDGVFNGYNWTGSAWQSDSAIASGLGDVGGGSTPTVFYKDGIWYLVSGEDDGVFNGYNWTGSIWQTDTAIASGLGDVGQFSKSTVFEKDSTWYLIAGNLIGSFYGYNWTIKNTTITGIEGSNNVTVYANDTDGNVGEEIVYFTVSTFVSNAVFSIALPSDYSSFTNTTGENETDATSYDWISFNFTSRPEYYVQPYQVGNAGNTQNGATQPIFLIDNTGNVNIDISFRFAESLPSGITVEGNASCSGTYTSCQSSSLQFGTSYSQLVNNLSYIDSFANITMYSNMSADASPNSTGFTMYIKGVES